MSAAWLPGLPRSLDYPVRPAGSVLSGAARRYGDRAAVCHDGVELSYTELHARACRFAHALHAVGIGHRDVVAVHMPNRPAYAVAYYGILLAGATFSPVNPLLPPQDVAFQLTDAAAVAVVTWGPAARVVDAVRGGTGLRLVVHVDPQLGPIDNAVAFDDFLAGHPAEPPTVDIDTRADLAHIAYTGGTTGRSKGVELPHRNVLVNALQYACWGNGALPAVDAGGDVTLDQVGPEREWPVRLGTGIGINLTPWFHAMGTIGALHVPLLAGATVVLHDRFDPGAYLADAERYRVTTMSGAPALYAALLTHPAFGTADLSSVRGLSSGAAPLPGAHLAVLADRLPDAVVVEGYGLTEVTMGATIGPAARSMTRKAGTVGLPVFDTELRVVAPGTDDPVPAGARGEVCIRGPQVMRGYRGRAEETAAVLTADGWLHTGDIGILDDEGYLSIVDRTKDMLIYKGYNVYPREIEELLVARADVTAAAVVGRRDDAVGELPVAFVVPAGPGLDPEALRAEVNAQLVPYKRLRELLLVEEIPVSAAGKVLKRELRERL